MNRQVKWMAGALAAALWIAPAGAADTSETHSTPTGSASGSDTTGRTTNPNTQSGMHEGYGTGAGSSATGSTATGSAATTDPSREVPTGSGTGSDTTGRVTNPNTQSRSAEGTTRDEAGASSAAATTGTAATTGDMASTLTKMHVSNQAEIQAGEWMKDHATNGKVKDFAKKMVDDHSKLDQDVNGFAKKHGVDLASAGSSPEMQHHEAQLEQLKGQTGAQLDRDYMRMQVQDHKKDVSEVRAAHQKAKGVKSEKEFASLLDKAAKKMEGHLKDAEKINKDLTQRQARTPQGQ